MKKIRFGILSMLCIFGILIANSCTMPVSSSFSIGNQSKATAATGFSIKDGKLLDANGKTFVMQGINHAHTWYKDKLTQALSDINDRNANVVRIVLSNGTRWTKDSATSVSDAIKLAKDKKLISVVEVHDTTGYGEDSAATTLSQAADYWIEIKDVLIGQEAFVIVNIANEPWGNNNAAGWTEATKAAIKKLRDAGIHNTLMIDAPNWGQDWSGTMKSQASTVFASDTDKNLIFSVHMYGVYTSSSTITSYLNSFANAKLPLVVGEFANYHQGNSIPANDIMTQSIALANGYIGWSWSGNGGGDAPLDMVLGFDNTKPSDWGKLLFGGLAGAQRASVFSTTPIPTIKPTIVPTIIPTIVPTIVPTVIPTIVPTIKPTIVPTPTPTPTNLPTINFNYSKNDWGTGFTGNLRITNKSSSPISNWTLTWSFSGNQVITDNWNGVFSQTGNVVTVKAVSWNNTIAPGATIEIGFNAKYTGTNLNPSNFSIK